MTKQQKMQVLIKELSKEPVENIWVTRKGKKVNVGLINHYKLHKFIPNKWFDWEKRVNAPIVVIGQDWGPYSALLKYIKDYNLSKKDPTFDYDNFLFKTFSSRTEKFILNAVERTYKEVFNTQFDKSLWGNFMFTMSVLFTRQGMHFRGNEYFDPKKSWEHSYKYVARQLEIVKPKVVISLGNMALETVNKFYSLNIKECKMTKFINDGNHKNIIQVGDTYIISNYHPAAHVDPKIQLSIWKELWNVIDLK